MYYDLKLMYKDGKTSWVTVMDYDYHDQLAYCQEGVRAGWLESYIFSGPQYDN